MNIMTSVDISAICLIIVVYLNNHQQVMFRLMFAGL